MKIYHHLGLGDHFICNGLTRILYNEHSDKHQEVTMVVKQHNYQTVKAMYSDLEKMVYEVVTHDNQVNQNVDNLFKIGFNQCNIDGITWDEKFYWQFNINMSERWNSFKINRNHDREKTLFEQLYTNKDYILVHSYGSDNVDRIDYSKIRKDIPTIMVKPHTDNMLDWLMLVEGATEIHCVDSSFKHLVDCVETNANLFYHFTHKKRSVDHQYIKKWVIY